MSETNPIALVDELKAVLERYIATTLPISQRYPNLAERFRNELAAQNLVSGPYVEALPDFEKGKTLTELTLGHGGFLHDALAELPTATRRLHLHQQRALELAARDGKSLLVATGTGSAKTETFLYPILMVLGFSVVLIAAGSNTLLQHWVRDDMRGRVMSVFSMSFLGIAPLGSLAVGSLTQGVGVRPTLFLCGLLTVFAGLAHGARLRRRLATPARL